MSEKISIVPPDPAWADKFRAEKEALIRHLDAAGLRIEHFGSTAVPGLSAKPIIDILVGCPSMGAADRILPKLLAMGYDTSTAFNAAIGERRFLRKRKNRVRTHHVHLIIFQGKFWKDSIRFRNRLRKDRRLAIRYEKLKLKYARLHENDREAYTDAKTPFIAKVLATRKSGTGTPTRSKKKAHA